MGIRLPVSTPPNLLKKSIEIKLSVTRGREKGGVLISHGGSRSGYSLYLEDGKPVFSCRLGGTLHTFRATKALPEGRASLSATLLPDGKVSLIMENEVVAEGKLPGPVQFPSSGSPWRSGTIPSQRWQTIPQTLASREKSMRPSSSSNRFST